jgi:RNA polymerase sigma-70 factor (ECF subfamily)
MSVSETSIGGLQKGFPQTVWGAGLEALCGRYWKPVYHHIRLTWRKSNEDAKDLTQAFFLWLIDGEALKRYAPERGSFRIFLKSLLRHFVLHHEEAVHRLKRGGGVRLLDLHHADAPLENLVEVPSAPDSEELFDRAWMKTLLGHAVGRVQRRLETKGGGLKFRVFKEYDLSASAERPTYAELARRHGIKETDVSNYLFAVREEIRSEIRAELSETTSTADGLEEEWNAFFGP